jgi:hypothetical protein
MEDMMTTMIFVILCIAAEGFMLHCLFHFGQERTKESRRESGADLWIAPPRSSVVPLQFIGHKPRSKGVTKEHYDAAA